jgi:hypothetical protein
MLNSKIEDPFSNLVGSMRKSKMEGPFSNSKLYTKF